MASYLGQVTAPVLPTATFTVPITEVETDPFKLDPEQLKIDISRQQAQNRYEQGPQSQYQYTGTYKDIPHETGGAVSIAVPTLEHRPLPYKDIPPETQSQYQYTGTVEGLNNEMEHVLKTESKEELPYFAQILRAKSTTESRPDVAIQMLKWADRLDKSSQPEPEKAATAQQNAQPDSTPQIVVQDQQAPVPGTPGGGAVDTEITIPEKTAAQKYGPLAAIAAGGLALYLMTK